MFDNDIETISKNDLFEGIQREDIQAMLHCLKPKSLSFQKNELVVTSGDAYRGVGLILKGEVTVTKENAAGNRVVIAFLKKGDLFGEVVTFSKQKKWPATVQADSFCEILFLPREKIVGECERLCPWHRSLIQNFLRILSEKALFLNKRLEYMTIKSMRGKISTYLLEQYKIRGNINITLPMNRNELSDFLNVSRPSMSREMGKMKEEGIIDFYLNTFKILDVDALKEIAALNQ